MELIRCISLHLQKAGEKRVIYVSFLRTDLFTFQCINGNNDMLMTGQRKVDYEGAEWRLQSFVNRLSPFPLPPPSSPPPPPLRYFFLFSSSPHPRPESLFAGYLQARSGCAVLGASSKPSLFLL